MGKKPKKEPKKRQFSVYLDSGLIAKYRKIATAEQRSLNFVIERELEKGNLESLV